MYCLRQSKRS